MHITTTDVVSVNGKITKGQDSNAHDWSSDEDWQHFLNLVSKHDLLVMGSRTYEMVKPEPQPERLRVVLTSRPNDYKKFEIPGQLEFISASPGELVSILEDRGYTRMLLVGGQINTRFFAESLVDEMYITIEPHVFGSGRNLLDGANFSFALKLQSVKQINERGTLVLHYLVDKA